MVVFFRNKSSILPAWFMLSIGLLGTANAQVYTVGACPGSPNAYTALVSAIGKVSDDKALRSCLERWEKEAALTRFRVEIYYFTKNPSSKASERRVLLWQKRSSAQSSLLATLSGTQSTAGRGGLRSDTKPGDNQRCFFQDTTVVIDTLRIRRGDFRADTPPELTINGKTYHLPATRDGNEWLLSASALNGVPTGRHLTVAVKLGPDESARSVSLYLFSPDDRLQFVQSLRNWMNTDAVNCRQLNDRLFEYLAENWGGKDCASPALYAYAQRMAIQRLIQVEHIPCRP